MRSFIISMIFLASLFVMVSCGTTYYDNLSGTVIDEVGNYLPGAKVECQSINGMSKIKIVETNSSGVFKIEQEIYETSIGVILTISKDEYQTVIISSEYRDWYKNQEDSKLTSLKYDFGNIRLKKLD